jgi:MerR family transcriptional regulator, light-induced transcriptional regulator
MYTIKQAARLTGVPATSLRAWERRYGIGAPRRTDAGYRLYDDASLSAIIAMRSLIDTGWAPSEAARSVRSGTAPARATLGSGDATRVAGEDRPTAADHMHAFLTSAALMRADGVQESLDLGFALGSFEQVVDSWLFPTLEALGEGWAHGDIDVAAEHAASHAVHRRLSAAFEAAGSRSRGPSVVVGLPPGSRHELGALAFATAIRRRGLDVLYLGADVPVQSWETAVRTYRPRAAVLAVVTPEDLPTALAVTDRLLAVDPALLIASGGAHGDRLAPTVRALTGGIRASAQELDERVHRETRT